MLIKLAEAADIQEWDDFARSHPCSTPYHLFGWSKLIQEVYGRKTYNLVCMDRTSSSVPALSDPSSTAVHRDRPEKASRGSQNNFGASSKVVGILPLVHLKHILFGNNLVSLPYVDSGGILADDLNIANALLAEAENLAERLGARVIELRHLERLSFLEETGAMPAARISWTLPAHKRVRMLLELPESSEYLFKSFKAKLRSQIRRPQKEGLHAKVGGVELLEDFYKVFSVNMRDLGSPVHSKRFVEAVLREFDGSARAIIVYKDGVPIACGVVVGFKECLVNPWASSLREYRALSPNMLLYWKMLEHACDNGFRLFDFGRSTPNEGTYRFKEQWGARAVPLEWQYVQAVGAPLGGEIGDKSTFSSAINLWKRLPVSLANLIGPHIRKHIGL